MGCLAGPKQPLRGVSPVNDDHHSPGGGSGPATSSVDDVNGARNDRCKDGDKTWYGNTEVSVIEYRFILRFVVLKPLRSAKTVAGYGI